jgi:hypothetical protein
MTLSFDIGDTGTNFKCTPTGTGTLTFTNHTAGQSGNILLDNSGGHAISLAATTKGDANLATTISAAGHILALVLRRRHERLCRHQRGVCVMSIIQGTSKASSGSYQIDPV